MRSDICFFRPFLLSRFITANETRLDVIIFAYEYHQLGSMIGRQDLALLTHEKQNVSLASFLMLTLLTPILLVAPTERDIRIINVVNNFYAAAAPSYSPTSKPPPSSPLFHPEGWRSLQIVTGLETLLNAEGVQFLLLRLRYVY
jgi:hypothetical protein